LPTGLELSRSAEAGKSGIDSMPASLARQQ
jgi:hypothetical protein